MVLVLGMERGVDMDLNKNPSEVVEGDNDSQDIQDSNSQLQHQTRNTTIGCGEETVDIASLTPTEFVDLKFASAKKVVCKCVLQWPQSSNDKPEVPRVIEISQKIDRI
ncbi:hypothetical protein RJT34_16961 [Clitoria ternatea]|uniref:Uncharacterized protein n=1 Tax=Clitoria ternatea TaxID=43366 RepID=A0AAN9PCT4_CLITE